MTFATLVIAYNEEDFIARAIQQWNCPTLVLVSKKPWNGIGEQDNTPNIAKSMGAEVIEGYWKTEANQRNYGLARLMGYDRVFIADADEFYTPQDHKILKQFIEIYDGEFQGVFVAKTRTYWKTLDYIFDPPDKHRPVICVDPKLTIFYEHRQTRPIFSDELYTQITPEVPVTLHHLSWVRSDKKVKEKIQAFSHAGDIHKNWFSDIWLTWKPGDNINVRPYGFPSIAIKNLAPELWPNHTEI